MRKQIDPKIDEDYKKIYGVGFLESQAIIQKNDTETKISILKSILAINNVNANEPTSARLSTFSGARLQRVPT